MKGTQVAVWRFTNLSVVFSTQYAFNCVLALETVDDEFLIGVAHVTQLEICKRMVIGDSMSVSAKDTLRLKLVFEHSVWNLEG